MGTEPSPKFKITLPSFIDSNPAMEVGFTCKWKQIEMAIHKIIGEAPNIKRLSTYIDKEDWRGLTVEQALNSIERHHDNSLNHKKKIFKDENGATQDFRITKRVVKLISAFKLVRKLPNNVNQIRHSINWSFTAT